MATAAELGLVAGGITIANEALFAPLSGHGTPFQSLNWRVVPATAVLSLLLAGLEQLSPALAKGLGLAVIATVFVAPFSQAGAPAQNLVNALGYGGKKK